MGARRPHTPRAVSITLVSLVYLITAASPIVDAHPVSAAAGHARATPTFMASATRAPRTNEAAPTSPCTATTCKTCDVTKAPYGADNTGRRDATLAIRRAIAVCEASKGTPVPNVVWFPAGTYALDLIDNTIVKNDLSLSGPHPVIFAGQGRTGDRYATTIVEHVGVRNPSDCSYALAMAPTGSGGGCRNNERTCVPYTDPTQNTCWLKNILAVQAAAKGSLVENISLDTWHFDAGTSLAVVADNVTVDHVGTAHRAAKGPHTPQFPVIFGGNGGSRLTPCATQPHSCHWGNVINDLVAYDEECDDGIVFAMQGDATITKLRYQGSRIALYVDSSVHITGFDYTPGVQSCPSQQGFAETSPSDHIYLTDYVDHNSRHAGGAGVVGRSQTGQNYVTNVLAIAGYVVSGRYGDQLSVQNVNGFRIGPSNDMPCSLGTNNTVHFNPSTSISTVSVQGCTLSKSIISLPPGVLIGGSGVTYSKDYFTLQSPQAYSFVDFGNAALIIRWSGGAFQNCPNSGRYLTNATRLTFTVPIGQQAPAGFPC
jgi:hypothetical protein